MGKILVCFASLLLATVAVTQGKNVMSNPQIYKTTIPDFTSPATEEMDRNVNESIDSYRQIIDNLIGQLRQENLTAECQVYLMYMLGRLRATASVTILIENIGFAAPKVDPKGSKGRWGMYPAQEALTQIGTPAVNMIMDKLPDENDELRRKLMCFVIKDVDGNEFGKARVQLKRNSTTDATQQANLDQALAHF